MHARQSRRLRLLLHTPTPKTKNKNKKKQAERALAAEPPTTAQHADTEEEAEAGATDQPNEWIAHALAPSEGGVGGLSQLVAIPLRVGPFPVQWPAVVRSARRVLAVAAAASAASASAAGWVLSGGVCSM